MTLAVDRHGLLGSGIQGGAMCDGFTHDATRIDLGDVNVNVHKPLVSKK